MEREAKGLTEMWRHRVTDVLDMLANRAWPITIAHELIDLQCDTLEFEKAWAIAERHRRDGRPITEVMERWARAEVQDVSEEEFVRLFRSHDFYPGRWRHWPDQPTGVECERGYDAVSDKRVVFKGQVGFHFSRDFGLNED